MMALMMNRPTSLPLNPAASKIGYAVGSLLLRKHSSTQNQ